MRDPGIYPDISDLDYHADDALSSTGAKALIECPAIYREQRDNPPVKDAFDFGHVAHRLLLGKGSEVAVYPADALDRGRDLNRRAIDLYAACIETGDWTCTHPAYAEIDLPRYAYYDKD